MKCPYCSFCPVLPGTHKLVLTKYLKQTEMVLAPCFGAHLDPKSRVLSAKETSNRGISLFNKQPMEARQWKGRTGVRERRGETAALSHLSSLKPKHDLQGSKIKIIISKFCGWELLCSSQPTDLSLLPLLCFMGNVNLLQKVLIGLWVIYSSCLFPKTSVFVLVLQCQMAGDIPR